MIQSLSGKLGGGKSYTAALWCAGYLKDGGTVVHNLPLKWGSWKDHNGVERHGMEYLCKNRFGWDVQPEQCRYVDFFSKDFNAANLGRIVPQGSPDSPVLLIIDEAPTFYDSYLKSGDLMEFLDWCRHTRHLNIDVLFIAQELGMLQKRLRVLCQFHWVTVDLAKFKMPLLRLAIPVRGFLLWQWDSAVKTRLHWELLVKDQRVFGSYETQSLNVKLKFSDEKVSKYFKKGKKKMSKGIAFMSAAALVLSSVACYKAGKAQAGNVAAVSTNAAGRAAGVRGALSFGRVGECVGVIQSSNIHCALCSDGGMKMIGDEWPGSGSTLMTIGNMGVVLVDGRRIPVHYSPGNQMRPMVVARSEINPLANVAEKK